MQKKDLSKEFLVGCLLLFVTVLVFLFGWLMGVVGPIRPHTQYSLLYAFAGGVEVGSPVRVSGVKVGKVERIEFVPQDFTQPADDRVTLKLTVGVSQNASHIVREDSKFYVNMAGIIGERYIEISPGSSIAKPLKGGAVVRGIDPPRIDQLLSQGYGVFGKIQDFLDENENTMTEFLGQLKGFMKDATKILRGTEKEKFIQLIENMNALAIDARSLTKHLHDAKSEKFFEQLLEMTDRAHSIDKGALKKFLQEEGIRARIF